MKMNMTRKKWMAAGGVAALLIALSAAATWAAFAKWGANGKVPERPAAMQADPHKYIGMERVVVMLRATDAERNANYAVLDIVLKTPPATEAATRDQLPMLRSVVVRTLSSYTLQAIRAMPVDDLSSVINQSFTQAYSEANNDKPFATAMIGKLLAE